MPKRRDDGGVDRGFARGWRGCYNRMAIYTAYLFQDVAVWRAKRDLTDRPTPGRVEVKK